MLSECTNDSQSTACDFVAPEVKYVRPVPLREDGSRVVGLQIGVWREGKVFSCIVVRIIES